MKHQAGSGGSEVRGEVMEDLRGHMKECVISPLRFAPQPGHCDCWTFTWSVRPRTALQNAGKFQTLKLNNLFIHSCSEYLLSIY